MFQREVAERIVAKPGDDAYGRLGVLCGWRTDARIAFNVAPQRLHAAAQGDLGGRASRAQAGRSRRRRSRDARSASPAPPSASAARWCGRASSRPAFQSSACSRPPGSRATSAPRTLPVEAFLEMAQGCCERVLDRSRSGFCRSLHEARPSA